MIKVTIEVISRLKKDFGHEGLQPLVIEETIRTGTSILDLLHTIAGRYPIFSRKAFTMKPRVTFDYCAVSCNKTLISGLTELDTKLKNGDTVKLLPHIYGG